MSLPNEIIPVGLLGTGGADTGYLIERSLRFNSADSAYLNRTPASASNRKTWTWAGWLKIVKPAQWMQLFLGRGGSPYPYEILQIETNSKITLLTDNSSTIYARQSVGLFRDPSAWYHIVVAKDTTAASASDRVKMYVNGVSIDTVSAYSGDYPLNHDGVINNTNLHTINYDNAGQQADYYLADIHFIDGQALDPTSFGEFDTNGIWQPIAYSGTYGTNGFHLPFSDNSTAASLGDDTSGNNNDWTVNNISVAAGAGNDSLVDVPTNGTETDTGVGGEVRGNYCTWNPLSWRRGGSVQLLDGNLNFGDQGVNNRYGSVFGTIAVASGKWYWDILLNSGTGPNSDCYIGVVPIEQLETNTFIDVFRKNSAALSLRTENPPQAFRGDSSTTTYGSQVLIGDVIGVALDVDNLTIEFYKNGVSMGTFPYGLASGYTWVPFVTDWSNDTPVSEFILNAGQRPFAYAAPSGFKALCTANLPAPTIEDGSTAMDVVTYTGNGTTQTISGLEFSPDLVWLKARNGAFIHGLFDAVRGTGKGLVSNDTNAETTYDAVTSFVSDGFTNGSDFNGSGTTYVAWTWDAGSSTVTNTDGSITSSVRANPSAGFSIVSWTGGTNPGTVGHGLGVSPELIILKSRDDGTSGWYVYHKSLGAGAYLRLDTTNASASSTTVWNNTTPSSTVISFNSTGSNPSGANIAYCFAPVEGYSAFGSYTGNGSADGPFVYTGFRPKWVMYKSATSVTSPWVLLDTQRAAYNVNSTYLYANASDQELDNFTFIDHLSNGFKLRSTSAIWNTSGATYIYAAFAENPFALNARAR